MALGVAVLLHLVVFSRATNDDVSSFTALQPAEVDAGCETDEQCRARCDAHHTPACRRLAAIREPARRYPDFERLACELGEGHECAMFADYLESPRDGREADPKPAAAYWTRAEALERVHCENGDASSCWYFSLDQFPRSRDCKACDAAKLKACSLGLLIACTTTTTEKESAWRTGVRIALGTCDRDRGLNILCTRAIAEITAVPLAADADDERRARRARSILAERLSTVLETRCPASIDACLGQALLEYRRGGVTDRDKTNNRVTLVIELLARGCDERKPDHCLGLAFLVGGRKGTLDESGLEAFHDFRDDDRARRAGLRACGLSRSRDADREWPIECDFILNRMKLDEVAEALKDPEYTE